MNYTGKRIESDMEKLLHIEEELHKRVVGQEDAIRSKTAQIIVVTLREVLASFADKVIGVSGRGGLSKVFALENPFPRHGHRLLHRFFQKVTPLWSPSYRCLHLRPWQFQSFPLKGCLQ